MKCEEVAFAQEKRRESVFAEKVCLTCFLFLFIQNKN